MKFNRLSPRQNTREKATATIGATYNISVFGRLDDNGGLLQHVFGSIDEGYVYYSAFACQSFHRAIRAKWYTHHIVFGRC